MNFKTNRIPVERKDDFLKQLSCMNASRMIKMFSVLATIELILFFYELIFETDTVGIQKILLIKLLFVVVSLFFASLLWILKKKELYKQLHMSVLFSVLTVLLLAVTNTLAAQKLVSDITIYIIAMYWATAFIRISYVEYAIIFLASFVYFVVGMQTIQASTGPVKWSLMNAIILNFTAGFIAKMLYDQTVMLFLDTIKLDEHVKSLEYMAEHDGLTDLFNHQTISRIIEREKEASRLTKNALSLAVIDIDNFKKINDEFGHIAGDQVLKGIAECIKRNVRENDFVARYGGDEFVILFPGVTVAEATEICKRVQDSIHRIGPDQNIVTGSIGLISLNDTNYVDFLKKADMKMYLAKKSGKAQIVN